MSIQTIKLELIKRITDIHSKKLLEKIDQFLRQAEMDELPAAPHALSEEETRLLSAINQGIPEPMQDRLSDLQRKQKGPGLSDEEEKELLNLNDALEEIEAGRLEHMLELATIWDISLDQLRDRLGIKAPDPYVW